MIIVLVAWGEMKAVSRSHLVQYKELDPANIRQNNIINTGIENITASYYDWRDCCESDHATDNRFLSLPGIYRKNGPAHSVLTGQEMLVCQS